MSTWRPCPTRSIGRAAGGLRSRSTTSPPALPIQSSATMLAPIAEEPPAAAEAEIQPEAAEAPAEPAIEVPVQATPPEQPAAEAAPEQQPAAEATAETSAEAAPADATAAPETPAVPELIEVWRPGGRSEERRPRHDRNRHRHHGRQDGAQPAAAAG